MSAFRTLGSQYYDLSEEAGNRRAFIHSFTLHLFIGESINRSGLDYT